MKVNIFKGKRENYVFSLELLESKESSEENYLLNFRFVVSFNFGIILCFFLFFMCYRKRFGRVSKRDVKLEVIKEE